MIFPWGEIGGGAAVGLIWVGRSLIMKRRNGKGNGKPGTSTVCTKNIGLISGHEILLTQLCTNGEKYEKAIIKLHDESREDYREINKKLDNLKGG